jgi:hypothetical protein
MDELSKSKEVSRFVEDVVDVMDHVFSELVACHMIEDVRAQRGPMFNVLESAAKSCAALIEHRECLPEKLK